MPSLSFEALFSNFSLSVKLLLSFNLCAVLLLLLFGMVGRSCLWLLFLTAAVPNTLHRVEMTVKGTARFFSRCLTVFDFGLNLTLGFRAEEIFHLFRDGFELLKAVSYSVSTASFESLKAHRDAAWTASLASLKAHRNAAWTALLGLATRRARRASEELPILPKSGANAGSESSVDTL